MALDLIYLATLTLAAASLGLAAMRLARVEIEHAGDRLALAMPFGLGCLALGVLALGELSLLGSTSLVGLGLVALAPLPAVARDLLRGRGRFERSVTDLPLAATLVGTFLTSLLPVTDGDALCYHLQVPKVFLLRGGVGFEPDLHETIYPLVMEMLYLPALALRGPTACRLTEWLLGLVFALNAAAIARPFLGRRARWAGTIALLVPAVSNGMTAPLNDVALAAFANAALFAWLRARDERSLGSSAFAGALLGFACGVKYPALVLGGVLGALSLDDAIRSRRFAPVLVLGLTALPVAAPWYLRAYLATGNPVFPFFRHVFGGAGLDEVLDPIKRPMPVTPWNILTALVPMTLDPGRFDSFSHQFGPMFLLFLPALLWENPPRKLRGVVGIGFVFLCLCLTQRQSMRFVLLALGPFSAGVAWAASRWVDRRDWASRGLVLLLLGCLCFETALAVARPKPGLRYLLGRESAEAYLARREPTFEVGRWIDANLPRDARIIGQDHRGYYLPRDYTMELAHRRRTGIGRAGESAEETVKRLRAEGFTHLMLCPPEPIDAVEFDPTLAETLRPWLADHPPIHDRRLADADGVVRRFQIIPLAPRVANAGREEVRR